MGLAKKVLIADKLAPTADLAFQHAGSLSAASAWTGLIVYSMQIYFDFSGYSDMALGLARIFSIRFPLNFDSPYKATSVTEYWQRWHMTLTRYITLYLYNPLLLVVQRRRLDTGRKISRKALATFGGFTAMVAYPTMLTMLLTGIWHGAGLQFLIFGLIHGIYLTANQAWRHFRQRTHNAPTPPQPKGLPRLAMMIGVYLQVTFALIFFRSESTHAAFALLSRHGRPPRLRTPRHPARRSPRLRSLPHRLVHAQHPADPRPGDIARRRRHLTRHPRRQPRTRTHPLLQPPLDPNLGWNLLMAVLFFAVLVNLDHPAPFLYFQF